MVVNAGGTGHLADFKAFLGAGRLQRNIAVVKKDLGKSRNFVGNVFHPIKSRFRNAKIEKVNIVHVNNPKTGNEGYIKKPVHKINKKEAQIKNQPGPGNNVKI